MTVANETREQWLERNPLRIWIAKHLAEPESGRMYEDGLIREMCDELGVTKQNIHAWLHGVHFPSITRLSQLCKLTKTRPSAWLEWMSQKPS